jgi:MFS family permease
VLVFLSQNRWGYGPLVGAISLNTIIAVGHASWGAAFFMRTYHWPIGRIALVSGFTWLLVAPVGAILGGLLAERWARAGHLDANLRVVLIALGCSLPFMIAAPLMPTGTLSATCGAIGIFFTSLLFGPQNAAIQVVTPNRMRGQVTAVVLFGFNIVGYGFGPTVTALVTDYVFRDEMQIGYALASTYAVLGPIALFIMFLGRKPYARAVAAARAELDRTND